MNDIVLSNIDNLDDYLDYLYSVPNNLASREVTLEFIHSYIQQDMNSFLQEVFKLKYIEVIKADSRLDEHDNIRLNLCVKQLNEMPKRRLIRNLTNIKNKYPWFVHLHLEIVEFK